MWNIPDQRVVDWADVHEMVTAVNFRPDGSKAIVCTMKGKCRFYRCSNFQLEYEAQIGEIQTQIVKFQTQIGKFQTQIGKVQTQKGKFQTPNLSGYSDLCIDLCML